MCVTETQVLGAMWLFLSRVCPSVRYFEEDEEGD